MCVLTLISDPAPGVSLVVAANRDEYLHRLSVPPTELSPGVVGGKDLEAGGTWLGLNRHGLFVAVTNRKIPPKLRSLTSRGVLCAEALALRTPEEVERFVRDRTAATRFAGFNLVAMLGGRGICLQFDGQIRPVRIDGGTHVLSSHRDMDDPRMPERRVIAARIAGWDRLDTLVERLKGALTDHEETDGWAVCKHGNGYGTVSSTLLVLPSGGLAGVRYWYSAGPSCRNPLREITPQAQQILGVAAAAAP